MATEIGVFLNVGAVAPELTADRDTVVALLSQICRDHALLA
jgi:hypothetical protein